MHPTSFSQGIQVSQEGMAPGFLGEGLVGELWLIWFAEDSGSPLQ